MPKHDPVPPASPPGADAGDVPAPAPAVAPAPHRLTSGRLCEWVREARPGARIVYARGVSVALHAPAGIPELARSLYQSGWVRMHLQRPAPGEPIDYLLVRTAKPMLAGSVL